MKGTKLTRLPVNDIESWGDIHDPVKLRIEQQNIALVKAKDEICLSTLEKAGANIDDIPQLAKDCENHIYPDGREILHYKGKPILVFYPPKYDMRREGISFYSDAGFKYKILI